jgi:Domain of unknown function (4846)
MKKIITVLFLTAAIGFYFFTKKGRIVKNVALSYVVDPDYIFKEGATVSERILLPDGFKRNIYEEGTFQHYLQQYKLKEFGSKIINYDGNEYVYQSGHVGILEVPVPGNGLQQCADALIRIRAEYLWESDRKDEIGFKFTSGHYCSWFKYAQGYRPRVNGSKVSFHKIALANFSKENFYKYLNLIYMYAGTQSLNNELSKVRSVDNVNVGDMLIYPGSPGHVILVVDKAENSNSKKLFIFAQGNTPAQSVHIIKNLNDLNVGPWYDIESGVYLEIPTYYFNEVKFVRFN